MTCGSVHTLGTRYKLYVANLKWIEQDCRRYITVFVVFVIKAKTWSLMVQSYFFLCIAVLIYDRVVTPSCSAYTLRIAH